MNTTSLLNDVSPATIEAAAVLCGMESASPAFRSWARNRPTFDAAFTVGDIARAYLQDTLRAMTPATE